MKKILALVLVAMGMMVVACSPDPTTPVVVDTEYDITITVVPNATDMVFGVWGSVGTNALGKFEYDSGWGGGNSHVTLQTNDMTNAAGELVFTIAGVIDTTNLISLQIRGSEIGDWSDTGYFDVPNFTSDVTKDVAVLYSRPTASVLGQTSTLNITLDITGITNAMDADGDATYGEIDDIWIGGAPAAVFGGYVDDLASATVTNLNTVALSPSAAIFSISLPAGTTTSIDTSIFGVLDATGMSWDQFAKVKASFALVDQAVIDVTLTAVNEDGGFGKVNSVPSGDVAVPQVSQN